MSIKRTLLFWLLAALTLVSTAFTAGTYIVERISIADHQDRRLRDIAMGIRPDLKRVDLRAINVKLLHGPDDFLLQIWSDGHQVYRSHADLALPRFAQPGFSFHHARGENWKLFGRRMGAYDIQVAQSVDARHALARERAFHVILPLLLLIPIIALCIPICVDRGLASLRRISTELDARDLDRLTPLDEANEPSEIAPVLHAINTLLARLFDAAELQQRFLADASHELRTPLTTLQIQAGIIEQADDGSARREAVAALRVSLKRIGDLLEKLLTTSRLDATGAIAAPQPVDLNAVIRNVMLRLEPIAAQKAIDLGLVRNDRASVIGDAGELDLLVRNLVDNAIRYTPARGQIDLSISTDTRNASFSVEDSGPGIPIDDRERVFERFYRRLGHEIGGSGLGLSIVRSVAIRHQATVHLDQSPALGGLRAAVSFSAPA